MLQLMFTLNIRIKKKCELYDLKHCTFTGVRWAGLNISETADVLGLLQADEFVKHGVKTALHYITQPSTVIVIRETTWEKHHLNPCQEFLTMVTEVSPYVCTHTPTLICFCFSSCFSVALLTQSWFGLSVWPVCCSLRKAQLFCGFGAVIPWNNSRALPLTTYKTLTIFSLHTAPWPELISNTTQNSATLHCATLHYTQHNTTQHDTILCTIQHYTTQHYTI